MFITFICETRLYQPGCEISNAVVKVNINVKYRYERYIISSHAKNIWILFTSKLVGKKFGGVFGNKYISGLSSLLQLPTMRISSSILSVEWEGSKNVFS